MALPSPFVKGGFAFPTLLFDLAYLVAATPTPLCTGKQRLTTFWLYNHGLSVAKVTFTNTAGVPYATNMEIAPESPASDLDKEFMYVNGLIITCDIGDVTCQLEGYAHVA
jgi:hypothetical protein